MQVTVTMSDDDMENLTTLSLSCGDSMLEEFSHPQESVLEMFRRVLCAYGFRFDNDERLALYNEKYSGGYVLITFGDLEEDRKFDKRKVAEANEVQSQKYGFWADKYAQAKTELDRAKANYDAVVATRALYYRRNPPTDIKMTEAVIEALVTADREVIDARDAVVVAQEAVNTYYAAVSSIQDVRSSIDNQVKLDVNRFYGEQDRDVTRDKLNGRKE